MGEGWGMGMLLGCCGTRVWRWGLSPQVMRRRRGGCSSFGRSTHERHPRAAMVAAVTAFVNSTRMCVPAAPQCCHRRPCLHHPPCPLHQFIDHSPNLQDLPYGTYAASRPQVHVAVVRAFRGLPRRVGALRQHAAQRRHLPAGRVPGQAEGHTGGGGEAGGRGGVGGDAAAGGV